jgi:tetratricopeptide (TPR) repeat protein
MNPKIRSVLIIIGLLTLIVIGIIVIPRGLSLYYQTKGGQHVEYVLRFEEGINELVCEQIPVNNEEGRNEVDQAIVDLNRAIRFNKNDAQAYYYLGKANCLLGNPTEAVENFEVYTQIKPNNPLGYIGLGFAYEELGDTFSAREAWILAGLKPYDFVQRSKEEYNYQDYSEALIWAYRVSIYGKDIESSIYFYESLLNKDVGDAITAEELLESAIEVDNGWIDQEIRFLAWYSWGKRLFDQSNYNDAKDVLNSSITLYPNYGANSYALSEVYRLLGLIYWSQGEYDLARDNLQIAIKTNNGNPWAHIHFGKILGDIDQNKLNDVEDEFAIALVLAPKDPIVWESIIQFWVINNFGERAYELCDQAIKSGIEINNLPTCEKIIISG